MAYESSEQMFERYVRGLVEREVREKVQTWETESATTLTKKMQEFSKELDTRADTIFAAKAQEVSIKVNLSLVTKNAENADPESQIIETPISVEHVSKEGEIKKRFNEIVGEYVNVLSMFVGVAAILYASIIPCAMMDTFTYLIIFACIGMGVFGIMGMVDAWKVVGERQGLARTDGPEPKSKWCYVGPPISKLVILFTFSAFLTIFLRFLMYDKSCGQEGGKPAEAPVVHWADQ